MRKGSEGGVIEGEGAFVLHEIRRCVKGFSFHKGREGLLVIAPDNGVALPITYALLGVYNSGTFVDGNSVLDASSIGLSATALAALFAPLTQVRIKSSPPWRLST